MAWIPWGEVDIPFIQNPFTNKNMGSVPILQKNWNGFAVPPPAAAPAPSGKVQGVMTDPAAVAAASGGGGSAVPGVDMAQVSAIRNDTKARGADLNAIYDELFGTLDNLARDRAGQVEKDYGDQFGAAAKQYTDSVPMIENSYASIGSGDSTDKTYAKNTAKEGFETTNKGIQKNKDADLTKIGSFVNEQKGKYNADRDSGNRLVSRVDETDDLGDLRSARNSVEDKIGSLKAEEATLGTDAGARGTLSAITGDAGRKDELMTALDQIIKSSLSGGVKQAAVKSVVDSGGLSDEDKKKVQAQYGNVFAEQAAL
jgi:hypothetical protein